MMKGKTGPLALCMIQPEPLPGSYRNMGMKIDEIIDLALREAGMVAENGFDGFILQNMNDMPVKQTAPPEAVAGMTAIAARLRAAFPELVMGVLVNWDGRGRPVGGRGGRRGFCTCRAPVYRCGGDKRGPAGRTMLRNSAAAQTPGQQNSGVCRRLRGARRPARRQTHRGRRMGIGA